MKLLLLSVFLISCSSPSPRPSRQISHNDNEDSLTWLIKEHKIRTRERKERELMESYKPEKPIECNYTCLGR